MTEKARIARLRESFDKWVDEDAAMSVALYTFGNPRLIQKATQEIIDVLNDWGLLGPAVDALQIGCGTGRVEALLSPKVRLAWGIDISAKMIGAARQKVAGLANVRFSQCSGRELSLFQANSFDLVYAVDSFPYIVEAGAQLVNRHFAEVARVLRGGGHFVLFHYSYRGDQKRDCSDVRRLAAAYGYSVLREAVTPFTIWDGVGYHLQKGLA
jgi:ubiquinone/menaquinone biosynthesis C-methylase UbiE